jgi:hypothetical protein
MCAYISQLEVSYRSGTQGTFALLLLRGGFTGLWVGGGGEGYE